MIRRLAVRDLLPGMYVVDLHQPWFKHDYWKTRFIVRDPAHIQQLIDDGISEVSIDTTLGADIRAEAAPLAVAALTGSAPPVPRFAGGMGTAAASRRPAVSLDEERRRAARLLQDASAELDELMATVRAGRAVDFGPLEPFVLRMIDSVGRNPDALAPLARLKDGERYATAHAIATAALIIALGQRQGLNSGELERMALGALLKDIGHAVLDSRLTEHAGQLSGSARGQVERHVEEGLAVLEATTRLAESSVAVILEHHERDDGSGYPFRLIGDEISLAGRMAAIVDTYDAMTSPRPYRAAWTPPAALHHLTTSGQHDSALANAFVRTVGIYPVGTLVMLESGHLAVVDEVHPENVLQPVVRVIYHAGRRQYVSPTRVDLARRFGNHYGQIVRAEKFSRWGLSAERWQPA